MGDPEQNSMDKLFAYLRDASMQVLREYGKLAEEAPLGPQPITRIEDLALNPYLVLIIIYSEAFQLDLFAHLNPSVAVNLAHKRLGKNTKSDLVVEFYKEYMNLYSGKIRADMAEANLIPHATIPTPMFGFNYKFMALNHKNPLRNAWQLGVADGRVSLSCFLSVFTDDCISKLNSLQFKAQPPKSKKTLFERI